MAKRDPIKEVAETDPRLRAARRAKRKNEERLRRLPNVIGVGAGLKAVDGEPTNRVCVRVYVSEKVDKANLRRDERVPLRLDGVLTDVVVSRAVRHQDRVSRHDPIVRGGVSGGNHDRLLTGTMGILVFDNVSKRSAVLSNWHVMCGLADGCVRGEDIVQPGRDGDGGTRADLFARLERWVNDSEVDAAIALLTGPRVMYREALEIGAVVGAESPVVGMSVKKSGRTTGLTTGVITDLEAVASFADGLMFNLLYIEGPERVSAGGDSGSVWVNDRNNVVGLHFAGPARSPFDHALANNFDTVRERLDISMVAGVTQQSFVGVLHTLNG